MAEGVEPEQNKQDRDPVADVSLSTPMLISAAVKVGLRLGEANDDQTDCNISSAISSYT